MEKDAGWYGTVNFACKLFDSTVRVVQKVFQWLSTLMELALKVQCFVSLPYVVWLFL